MPELDLWMACLDRDDVQDLAPATRMALVSIAATIANNQPEIDGFLPRAAVRGVPWGAGVNDLLPHLDLLIAAGFLACSDDPEGWYITGWLSHASRYQAGNANSVTMAWGQRSAAYWRKKAEQRNARSRKNRAAGRARTDTDDESDE